MIHGTYIGPVIALKGETALLQEVSPSIVQFSCKAQFDNLALGHEFTHAWLPFELSDWEIDTPEDPCT